MRIKLICGLMTDRGSYSPGQVIDWPVEAEARRFVERGYATLEDGSIMLPPETCRAEEIETAALTAPETMAKRRGRPRNKAAVA